MTTEQKCCILVEKKGYRIMSKKEYKKYQQSIWYKIERFFDRHNHLMEFIRTILALVTITLQLVILSRIVW